MQNCQNEKGVTRCLDHARIESAKLDVGDNLLKNRIKVEEDLKRNLTHEIDDLRKIEKCVNSNTDESKQKECMDAQKFMEVYDNFAEQYRHEQQTIKILLERTEDR